jgi:hypothetical protein
VSSVQGELRLQLSEQGADEERLEQLTSYLREELLQLDVLDVTAPAAGAAPPGARAIDPAVVGQLVVSLGPHAAVTLRAAVAAIRRWLRPGGVSRSVRLEIDGDVLELSEATLRDQDRLVEFFVSRHAPGDGAR